MILDFGILNSLFVSFSYSPKDALLYLRHYGYRFSNTYFNEINVTDTDGIPDAEPSTSDFDDALLSNPSSNKKKDTGTGMFQKKKCKV